MISILDVANYFLSKSINSNIKLNYLCFISQSLYMVYNKEFLFEEDFQSWIHGSICPTLYHSYKNNDLINKSNIVSLNIEKDSYLVDFLDNIYDIFNKFKEEDLKSIITSSIAYKSARGYLDKHSPCWNIINKSDILKFGEYLVYL